MSKSEQPKIQHNKTTLVQLPLTTLGQETKWAYSTTLPSPHGPTVKKYTYFRRYPNLFKTHRNIRGEKPSRENQLDPSIRFYRTPVCKETKWTQSQHHTALLHCMASVGN